MTEKERLRQKRDQFWSYMQAKKKAREEGRDFETDRFSRMARNQFEHKPYEKL